MPWESGQPIYEIRNDTEIGLTSKISGSPYIGNEQILKKEFMSFDSVFDREASNLDVFNETARKLVENMMATGTHMS